MRCRAKGSSPRAANARAVEDVDALLAEVLETARTGDTIVVMSNGGFEGFSRNLAAACKARAAESGE